MHHKGLLKKAAKSQAIERHFHDYDQTWIVLSGTGTAYWIDRSGKREDFVMEAGDVLMTPAGYEHGSEGDKNSEDYTMVSFNGSLGEGAHPPAHYYMEKEGYIPTLTVKKTPTNRYKKA